MNTNEESKKPKEKKTQEKSWQMIPFVLERISAIIEGFTENFLSRVSERANGLVNRGVQRLFGLLCLGAGTVFFLVGGSQVLDAVIGFPGIGAMIVGLGVLLLTALFILARRTED